MIPEPGDIWYYKAPYAYDGPLLIYKQHLTYLTLSGPEYQFLALELSTGIVDYYIFNIAYKNHWKRLA